MMLPSFGVQIFNTFMNALEAGLLVYIAIQARLNNQAIRDKQLSANERLDTIFEALKQDFNKARMPKKGKIQ